ncbi:DNA helicase-2/ATP-dependent DNA helicase PcrA [Cryobacterium mesophilum]|uniref:DNA 3'-5' helicase n=2 Tax=Terrimesophilobacter mesophilus TaxID=433647 RepID=A0A4R8VB80_9MICO|nr:ATP-dependent DNA helicase [Terrimesophilobacter mesophilus]MBB5633864.1 DNA helicase-2/ATP-dependent DNA helicase PcrA [Terrimesophilobacter mesophilus]TFB80541.1 ATP-dependent helicase [Terrimesophilobacter mesophilus]
MPGPSNAKRVGADELADALGLPRPTDQQRAVIESDLGPSLVIAGAGSGKTETMANRVVWLLANGHVEAGEILGLTFTRKAAGELAERIRKRIGQLAKSGIVSTEYDAFDPPTVSTYNSFANSIFRDNAILLGRETDGSVLGEASAWQLARSIVVASRDERLAGLDRSVDQLTNAVLDLSHALSENVADPVAVSAMAERFAGLAELPNGGRGEYQKALDLVASVGTLPLLVDLAVQFSAAKAHNGFVEYSDQVMLALQVIRRVPRVGDELRDRYRVVLLDEYQDTSVVQTWLLSELFAGHPVMAVGDPNQSIYGWRGASAANLEQFATGFGRGGSDAMPVREFALSTSWRNGHGILAAANTVVEPLIAATSVSVEKLTASPVATDFPLEVRFEESIRDEARAAANWLSEKLASPEIRSTLKPGQEPTAAMLFRARRTQAVFVEALREAGVPYHVLGIGGLLDEPEVADLVSALTVVNDPAAGSELVRLLAGSRWRIGVRDLHALSRLASWLRDRDHAQQPLDEETKQKLRSSVAEGEGGSIVDALDFVAHARAGHSMLSAFSDTGLDRLRDAGRVFSRLRSRASIDLLDFVTLVEQEFRLDIETIANDTRSEGAASMEAFFDALGAFRAVNDGGTVGSFLGWLREAVRRDDLAPRPEDPEPGAVQLLTIHGAKGLEWDLVVVPRMVVDELPAKARDTSGWTAFGALPYEFRGDAESLPDFPWQAAESRKDLLDRHDDFKAGVKARHELEERRLAYVAVTRARHALLLTGSFWSSQAGFRAPSPYLVELQEAGIIDGLPDAPLDQERPEAEEAEPLRWPSDPLGGRRERVERAAELVRTAEPGASGTLGRELELLLAERERMLAAAEFVALPNRVPASRFKDFVTDPAEVAAGIRRPMPEKPYRATRLGTLFHSWVEERSGLGGSREVIDSLSDELETEDVAIDAAELERLQGIFERSAWAGIQPVEVERELHLPFDGRVVICKIDAVYERDGRFQIVDWKTGKAPKNPEELAERQLQLALYRLAFAKWKGIDPSSVDAVFYYVSDDRVIEPDRIYDEEELLALWRAATDPG